MDNNILILCPIHAITRTNDNLDHWRFKGLDFDGCNNYS